MSEIALHFAGVEKRYGRVSALAGFSLDVQRGEFVAVTGRTPTGWLFVNGDDGNVPGVVGFIAEMEMNASGPCDSIPTVAP